MITFTVAAPLEVPLDKYGQIGLVTTAWYSQLIDRGNVGCYIFAVPRKRGAAGFIPIYVGKTERTFAIECFSVGNLLKLGEYLRHHPPTKLLLFLVVHPVRKGVPNGTAIGELEAELIRLAYKANPRLINQQNTKPDCWTVRGLFEGTRRSSKDATQLREVLGLVAPVEPVNLHAVCESVAKPTATSAPVPQKNNVKPGSPLYRDLRERDHGMKVGEWYET